MLALLSSDGDCKEECNQEECNQEEHNQQEHSKEEREKDCRQQDGSQEERKEEYKAGGADEPLLAWIHPGARDGAGRKGKLRAEEEADSRRKEG